MATKFCTPASGGAGEGFGGSAPPQVAGRVWGGAQPPPTRQGRRPPIRKIFTTHNRQPIKRAPGGLNSNRNSGKPLLRQKLHKPPPGPSTTDRNLKCSTPTCSRKRTNFNDYLHVSVPGPPGPPRGSFYGLSIKDCKYFLF